MKTRKTCTSKLCNSMPDKSNPTPRPTPVRFPYIKPPLMYSAIRRMPLRGSVFKTPETYTAA
ncbi:MAG: hypothetical protein L6V35_00155 [Alistipes putredinis]|nr:MAG: hypothetical protein L6V35_00155 [Alistipes putredinis]